MRILSDRKDNSPAHVSGWPSGLRRQTQELSASSVYTRLGISGLQMEAWVRIPLLTIRLCQNFDEVARDADFGFDGPFLNLPGNHMHGWGAKERCQLHFGTMRWYSAFELRFWKHTIGHYYIEITSRYFTEIFLDVPARSGQLSRVPRRHWNCAIVDKLKESIPNQHQVISHSCHYISWALENCITSEGQ